MTPIPPDPATVQNPFSNALALKILKLIQERDIQLLDLREKRQSGEIARDQLLAALEAIDIKTTDDVTEACRSTMARLEITVNQVLQIQQELNKVRMAEAGRMGMAT